MSEKKTKAKLDHIQQKTSLMYETVIVLMESGVISEIEWKKAENIAKIRNKKSK